MKELQSQVTFWQEKSAGLDKEQKGLERTIGSLQQQVSHMKITGELYSENSRMAEVETSPNPRQQPLMYTLNCAKPYIILLKLIDAIKLIMLVRILRNSVCLLLKFD